MSPMETRIVDGTITLLERDMGDVPLSEGNRRKIDLKLQPNYLKRLILHCQVTGSCTTAVVTPTADAPFNLIDRLEVRASNGLLLKSCRGISLALLNKYEFFTDQLNQIPAALGGAAWTFGFDLLIPFENHTGLIPERTALNMNEFNEVTLTIWWAANTVLSPQWTPAAPDVIDSIVCSVVTLERTPVGIQDETQPKQRMIDTYQQRSASAVPMFTLPENTMLKTLMAITRDGDGLRSNAVLSDFRVTHTNDEVTLRHLTPYQIQSLNKSLYHVEQTETGVYIIEFDQDHDFTELFNTKNKNYARLHWEEVDPPGDSATVELFRRVIVTPAQLTP